MRRLALAVLLVPLIAGCHAKFKHEVGSLGAVRTQPMVTGGPYVQLGQSYDNSLAGAVVDVVQSVKSVNASARISDAVQIDKVDYSLQEGIRDSLGSGPPFPYTDDPKAPVLQLEVMSYGLEVPYIGAPGAFTYDIRAKIYKPDGERVYTSHVRCSTAAGDPPAVSQIFGTVNNVKQLKEMSDQQIQDAFDGVAYWCGGQLVAKMRRHASR